MFQIISKIWSILRWSIVYLFPKFHGNPSTCFWVILLKQMGVQKHYFHLPEVKTAMHYHTSIYDITEMRRSSVSSSYAVRTYIFKSQYLRQRHVTFLWYSILFLLKLCLCNTAAVVCIFWPEIKRNFIFLDLCSQDFVDFKQTVCIRSWSNTHRDLNIATSKPAAVAVNTVYRVLQINEQSCNELLKF